MQARDIMTKNPVWVTPTTTLQEAAQKMDAAHSGSLLIGENDRLTGFLTDHDILVQAVAKGKNPQTTTVADCANTKILYCFESDNISDVAANMQKNNVLRLVVLDKNKRLQGIISQGDLAKAALQPQNSTLSGDITQLAAIRKTA
jgi:CBS domain-containing protein